MGIDKSYERSGRDIRNARQNFDSHHLSRNRLLLLETGAYDVVRQIGPDAMAPAALRQGNVQNRFTA